MNIYRRNKIPYSFSLLILAAFCLLGVYINGAGKIENSPLRLHVIANSDSPYDQQVKLIVKDRALELLNDALLNSDNKKEAMTRINSELAGLEEGCREVLAGYADYDLKASLGKGAFPTKAYGNMLLPAGDYEALKIVLGEGKGKNWWCVLFPPLCFIDIAGSKEQTVMSSTGDFKSPDKPDKEEIQIRLKINELLGKW